MITREQRENPDNLPENHFTFYRCPNCGGVFHRLTLAADTGKPANGTMFTLLDYYRDLGWESFEEAEHTVQANLSCPECNMEYTDTITGIMIPESIIKGE